MRRFSVLASSLVASACVADLDRLRAPDAGPQADARPIVDAQVAADAEPTADAEPAVDAGACAAAIAPVTLPVGASWIDLAPSGDRVLVSDGVDITVHALPSGEVVQRTPGVSGALSADGRALFAHRSDGAVELSREGGASERITRGVACAARVTPDRTAFVVVEDCAISALANQQIGRLRVRRFDGLSTREDTAVLIDSLHTTPRGAPSPRLAYLREPRMSPCSVCPTWVAEVVEMPLEGGGGGGAPRIQSFRKLVGYTPDGARLLASGATCGCTPERDAEVWDLSTDRALGITPAPWPWSLAGLDEDPRQQGHAVPAVGSGGVAGYASGAGLVYASFLGGAPNPIVPRGLPTPSAVVGTRSVDTHVLTGDDLGRPARVAASGGMIEPLSSSAGFGVRRMFVSAARTDVAFTVEYQGQVVIEELAMGRVDGEVRPVFSSSSIIRGLGFVGERPDFLVEDQGTLRLFRRDGRAQELDIASDPTGPVASDARGCWVAHRRAGAPAEVRVVPVPP